MSIVQTIHVSVDQYKLPAAIHAVQNDSGRTIKMVVDDLTLTAGMTGKLSFRRSSGTYYELAATLDTATNSFSAELDQALTSPGTTHCQLKVTSSGELVSSFDFDVFVEEDRSGTVTPEEGISISQAVEAAEDAADRAESAASMFDEDVQGYVGEWLDDHPEATTTVQDGAITYEKLNDSLKTYVTPEMFGAKGDGVADDTAALQSCITNNTNVVLTGTYRITSVLNFTDKHDIWIFGGKITRDYDQTFNTISGTRANNIHFVGVTFDGNGNNRDTSYSWKDNYQICMVLASQCKNIYIEDCKILNHNYGIFILGADVENAQTTYDNTSMNGVIRNCTFHNCHSAIDTYGKNTLIDHNTFYENTGACVQLEGNDSAQDIDNPILDNQYFNSVTGAIVSNNLFIDNAFIDINIFPNSYGISIHGNLHIDYYQAIKADCYGGAKGINIHHNSYICQKDQTIDANKRPTTYTAAIELTGKINFDSNFIFSPYVGIYSRGNSIITNNFIDKPKISGIAIYDISGITGVTVLKGNAIDRHTPSEGTWYGCNAIYLGNTLTTLYILDTIIYTTLLRPILAASGTSAIVKNLMSNAESLAIAKPSGVYDYSN